MSDFNTDELIAELVELIRESGGSQVRADWLEERQLILERQDLDPSRRGEVLRDIHRHIPGMNGLVDQYLVPPPSSGLDRAAANARLAELCDLLFDATSEA